MVRDVFQGSGDAAECAICHAFPAKLRVVVLPKTSGFPAVRRERVDIPIPIGPSFYCGVGHPQAHGVLRVVGTPPIRPKVRLAPTVPLMLCERMASSGSSTTNAFTASLRYSLNASVTSTGTGFTRCASTVRDSRGGSVIIEAPLDLREYAFAASDRKGLLRLTS